MSRELDARVARAMGLELGPCECDPNEDIERDEFHASWWCSKCGYIGYVKRLWRWTDFSHDRHVSRFSTDIAAAWQVVEWMITGKPWECYLTHQFDGWSCGFHHPGARGGDAKESTAPEAICLAFLAAMNREES